MTTTAAEIAPLPPQTRSILRSSIILTSLVQLVSELIQNSLDANASSIDVGIDCEEWSCIVQDNGDGMSKNDLDIIANAEQPGDISSRYSTSKSIVVSDTEPGTLGFRGEALASAADLSILEISSRTASSNQNCSIILKSNQNLYIGPSIRWKRESHGTTVCVRDAFYNLPVRRRSHPSASRTIELIRKEIETYSLVFPDVSFTLRHSGTQKKLMAVPRSTSTVHTFRQLFGRALVQHLHEIDKSWDGLKLNGFISLSGTLSKSYQFLYINRHPLSVCDLHRAIDKKFALSTFAKHAYDESGENHGPRPNTRRPSRHAEKKPIYVLNITVPRRHVDNCLDPAKMIVQVQNNEAVLALVSSTIDEFLVENRFVRRPNASQRHLMNHTSMNENVRSSKRIKLTHDNQAVTGLRHSDIQQNSDSLFTEVLYAQNDAEGSSAEINWTDPTTGEIFVVDARTGNSYPLNANETNQAYESVSNGLFSTTSTRRTLSYTERKDTAVEQQIPEWIQAALQNNDVYAVTEPRIPVLPLSSVFTSDMQRYESEILLAKSRKSCSRYSTHEGSDAGYRFAREDLGCGTVLGQVDQKFVACLVDESSEAPSCSRSPSKSLVLIDQHAADERIRVERYLKDLCSGFLSHGTPEGGVKVTVLDQALPLLLTRHEALMLKRSHEVQSAFASWGVRFESLDTIEEDARDEEDEGSGYVQVFVKCVPEVVSSKLLMSEDLRELVKGYLAELNRGIPAHSQSQYPRCEDEFSWQKAVRKCPSQLLSLINSRACRGAIMFNDPLTLKQCEKLVQQLSKAAIPFRCAHGRPSLVPLISLGIPSSALSSKSIDWDAFMERSGIPTRS